MCIKPYRDIRDYVCQTIQRYNDIGYVYQTIQRYKGLCVSNHTEI